MIPEAPLEFAPSIRRLPGGAGFEESRLTRDWSVGVADVADVADVVYVGFVLGHGGDALQMLQLARGVQASGCRVRIVVPELETTRTFKQRCDALGIECERSPLLTATSEGARQKPLAVARLLRSLREPIVHFHTGNSLLPLLLLLNLMVQRHRRSFATIHSPYETIRPKTARARLWAFVARRRLAAVVSPSEHGSSFQRSCGIDAHLVRTIHNCVDLEAIVKADPDPVRRQLGVANDIPLIVFTSRLDLQKRPVDAVRIFALISSEHPTARLVFVGSGDEHDAIVTEARLSALSDRVDLVGYQKNVPDWLAASTIWLLPTERENFSVAVLEALAAGCTVLATECEGNREVLVDGANARTFPVGDIRSAGRILGELLVDDGQRDRLTAGARATASRYSIDEMVNQYCHLYQRTQDLTPALRARLARDERG